MVRGGDRRVFATLALCLTSEGACGLLLSPLRAWAGCVMGPRALPQAGRLCPFGAERQESRVRARAQRSGARNRNRWQHGAFRETLAFWRHASSLGARAVHQCAEGRQLRLTWSSRFVPQGRVSQRVLGVIGSELFGHGGRAFVIRFTESVLVPTIGSGHSGCALVCYSGLPFFPTRTVSTHAL